MDPPRTLARRDCASGVRGATLARRSGEALLDRPENPGRPVADHEQRIPEGPLMRRSWKNARTVSTSSFEPAINPQQRFASVLADPPSCEDGFPPLARPQPLGDAVDERR